MEISKRRGIVEINRELLLTSSEEVLREIFSNIFPIYIDCTHSVNYYDTIRYHCLSSLFEEVEEACRAPYYQLEIQLLQDSPSPKVSLTKIDK